MFKKFFLTSFLLFLIIGVYYPSKREKIRIFDYCYSLEKILSRNAIQKRKDISEKVKSLSRDISRFGVNNTRGSLMNKMINQYKTSKNSFILNIIPNKSYCFSGYWIEKVMPGKFESVIYDKGKKRINEFREFKEEFDGLINKMINQYKASKDSPILNFIPNNIYCFSGYWIEKVMPGKFESLIYNKGKKKINELKEFKEEVDGIINNINSEYKDIIEEINSIF